MRITPLNLFLFILALLSGLPALAEEQVTFRNLTTADGLSSNQISVIYRDSRGFLWVGTEEGVDRYDAYDFCRISTQDGLPGKSIMSISEDPFGQIWIVTPRGSVCYSYSEDRLIPEEEALRAMGITISDIVAVGANASHTLFWAQGEQALAVYSATREGRAFQFSTPESRYVVPCAQEERIYFASPYARLYSIDFRTGDQEEIPFPEKYRSLVTGFVPRLYADRKGGLWLYTYRTDYLFHYTPTGGWSQEFLPKTEGKFNSITALSEDSSGNIWATTSHEGLFLFRADGSRQQMTHDPSKRFSLPGDNLVALHIDQDDIVWVGNFKLGLSSYAPRSLTMMHYNVGGTNDVLSFCETEGGLYLGTDGSGLFRARNFDEPFTPVPTGTNVINCILQDSRGDFWLGSWENGLVQLGPDGRKKAVYASWNSGLNSNSIFRIREGADGAIYIGLYLREVQRLDPKTGTFTTLYTDPEATIYDFIILDDGTLVVGTSSGLRGSDILPLKADISALYEDSRKRLWIASREGVWYWSPETGKTERLGIKDGLASDSATGITEDLGGHIWLSTTQGISSLDLSGETPFVQNYTLQDGLGWAEFNQRSLVTLSDGSILAGTPQGFTAIRPKSTYSSSFDLPIFLTRVDYSNTVRQEPDRMPAIGTTRMVIRNDMLPLSLHFSCLDFDRQNTVSYEYKIKGFGDQWLPMQENVVKFSVLPPGRYELSVRACNAHQVWSSHIKTLTLIVKRPWYVSRTAMILYILFLMVAVAQFIRHTRKKRELDAAIRRINQEAEDQKRLLDMKLNFFSNVSHELRTPLSLIINPLDEFFKRYPQYATGFLSTVRSNAGYLKELIDQLLSFRKIDAGGEQMHYVRSNVVLVLSDVFMGYQTFAEGRKIQYGFSAQPQSIPMDFDREKMMKMLNNLLSNAFKFTPDGGQIDVEVRSDGDNLLLRVKDTGSGIPQEDREKVFRMFYQVEGQPHPQGGSGIGLYLVDQYVRMHSGTIEVSDNTPAGTVFTIRIPLIAQQSALPENSFTHSDITLLESPQKLLEHTLLLVDDNVDFLDFLAESLRAFYRVFRAADGDQALAILQKEEIDLVVSDVMMPNKNGLELCQEMKKDSRTAQIPVILLTAKSADEFQLEGLRQGADDYITKPFNMEILLSRIQKLIEKKKSAVGPSRIEVTSLDQQFIEKAVSLVEDNLSNADFSVEELAAQLGISRGYLYRKLSQITGKSAIEFIRTIRMKRAQQLLVESQLQIAEVAYRMGYHSPKIFSKHFKSVFGVLPSEYVRSWKKE